MGSELTAAGMRPVIGVSASEVRNAETIRRVKEDEPPSREIVLGTNYIKAIASVGGMPVVVPPLDSTLLEELLDGPIGGLCISGGPDLDPSFYGREPDPNLGATDPDFDLFELELVRQAVERQVPILAICRGVQVLNVSLGGTLIQHLPDCSSLGHRQEEPGYVPGHSIEILPDSRLAVLAGQSTVEVNTYHHQAIHDLGRNLSVAARAPDGVIEAVEGVNDGFILGLQWHAELMMPRRLETEIFSSLVDAAATFTPHRAGDIRT